MVRAARLYGMLLDGRPVRFAGFERVLVAFGFSLARTAGSHRIYSHPAIPRPFPIQTDAGAAKRYQIRQFLDMVEEHGLRLDE